MSILITNNPLVYERFYKKTEIVYFKDGSYIDVLYVVRDLIHKGHTLLTHPLSGSIKPNETPYKSITVSKIAGILDTQSLYIIEDSIVTYNKFFNKRPTPCYLEHVMKDFMLIDYDLISDSVLREC